MPKRLDRVDTSIFFRYDPSARAEDEVVFLEGCSESDWQHLTEFGERKPFRSGEVVIRQGDRDRSLLIVLDGELQTTVGAGRKRRRLSAVPTGSVIGELSFLDGASRSADVVAESDGEVLKLDFDAYEALMHRHPALGHRILLDLARIAVMRVRRLTTTVTERT